MAITLYNNKINESLKFKIDASGISTSTLEARLIFLSDKSNTIVFGNITESNTCVFDLPILEGFKVGDSGKLQFELINEDSYFKVWENTFEIASKGEIKVEQDSSKNKNKPTGVFATLEQDPIINQPTKSISDIEKEINKLNSPIVESKDQKTNEKIDTKLSKIATDIDKIYKNHYNKTSTSSPASSFQNFIDKL